ncbi:MAG: hypothetical protein WA121_02785 [Syntrophales bacterium]
MAQSLLPLPAVLLALVQLGVVSAVVLLWQALRKFKDDNGFFLSSGIAFNIPIGLHY